MDKAAAEKQLAQGKTMTDLYGARGYVALEQRYVEPYLAYGQLGRDFNGGLLVADGRAWLDENGISDPGERGYFWSAWRALESERHEVRAEEDAARKNKD